jgi:hypothetical protein
MMLQLNRPIQLKRATRWVLALFVLSVLNMSLQIPVHAAMQQAMQVTQQDKALSLKSSTNTPLQQSHCEMQAAQQQATEQQKIEATTVPVNASSDDCCCPPALCDAVQAQQDKLFQQADSIQLLASLAFYPVSFESQIDSAQIRDVVSLRYQDVHYRQISQSPLSLNTVLLI